MTPLEFKAWFEGYTEAVEKVPTRKQWERIMARVAEIDGKVTTHTVFYDRYWPPAPYYGGLVTHTFKHTSLSPTVCGVATPITNLAGEGIGHMADNGPVDITSCFAAL